MIFFPPRETVLGRWEDRVLPSRSVLYWSNWHPSPLHKGSESSDLNLLGGGVRSVHRGQAALRGAALYYTDKAQKRPGGRTLWPTSLRDLGYMHFWEIMGPSRKGALKCWNRGAFSWVNSCGPTRCLTAGFSLFIACFQSVFTGASVGGWCLSGRLDQRWWGAEHWDLHRKTAVKEITRDCRNVHTNSSALFFRSLLLVWGLDQSAAADQQRCRCLRACWKARTSGSAPDLLDQNLPF